MTAVIPEWGNAGIVGADCGRLLQNIIKYGVEFIRMSDLVTHKMGKLVTYNVGQHVPVVVSPITVL